MMLKKLLAPVLALLIGLGPVLAPAPVSAAPAAVVAVGLGGYKRPCAKASYCLDFQHGYYWAAGARVFSLASYPGFSYSGGCAGCTATDLQGVVHSFAVNTPRITNAGLLVEPAATNQLTYSTFSSNWGGSGSLSANTNVAPDGTSNSATASFTDSLQFIYQGISLTSSTYTFSCWIKLLSGVNSFQLNYFNGTSSTASAVFTATTTWQRFSYSFTGPTNAGNVAIVSAGASSFAIWGAQLETGSFATSYIPTTTAAVTRAADVAKVTGVSVGSAYTLAARAVLNAPYPVSGKLFTLASLGDGTANNAAYLARRDVSSGWQTSVQSGGSTVLNGIGGTPTSGLAQLALSASSTALTGVANGATIATGSGALPVSPSILEIGDLSWATPQAPVDGVVQRVSIYPTALTGSQLQSPSL